LFNVKKSRLLHDPYSNQSKENGITEQTSKPEGFSNPPPHPYCHTTVETLCELADCGWDKGVGPLSQPESSSGWNRFVDCISFL
ncbi:MULTISPECIES: hypothetical protein, partial [Asaia]|uniref:hypothetical protein n=1 Tax=Asaia TaxID=91914 RepID=UPI002FC372B1